MKKFLVIILLTIGAQAYAGHETKRFLIQFATDQHELDPTALQKLNEVTEFLKAHPKAKIKLTGRTDFDGTVGYNLTLSRLRTAEVAEHLKTKGWLNAEINEKWVGELKPLATNMDDDGKALNRSVEILVTVLNYDNAAEWLKEKQAGYEETYKLSRSGQNTILTNNETVVTIPAGAFVGPDGKMIDNKNVNVVIKEVNTALDAIIHQVYTMSGDKLLETGGMINIEAFSNTTPLQVANGKEISIQIPTAMQKEDMFVFEGVADNTGKIDWINTGKKFGTNAKKEAIATKLNETILNSLISRIELDKPGYRDLYLTYNLPKISQKPSKPREPKKPEKADARQLFSTLGWVLSTPQMREKKVESLYKKDMEAYAQRMKNHERRMANYEKALTAYQNDIANLDTEKQKFDEWVNLAKDRVKEQKNAWKEYYDKKRITTSLTNLGIASKNGTLYTKYPMGTFKYNAVNTKLTEEAAELRRLSNIEYTLNMLAKNDIQTLKSSYSFDDEVDVYSISTRIFKRAGDYSYYQNSYDNTFLDSFISANKTDLEKVFGTEVEAHYQAKERQMQIAKEAQAQKYFMGNTKKMGWINCDRFINQPLVRINTAIVPGACQVVILKSTNSVLSTSSDPLTSVNYASIPQNSKFKLLTLKIEGDQGYIAINEGVAQKGLRIEPEFKKVPLEEISQLLAKL